MTKEEYKYYIEGVITGLEAYAWWKDGTQYVGTCGTTLKDAIQKAKESKLYNMNYCEPV